MAEASVVDDDGLLDEGVGDVQHGRRGYKQTQIVAARGAAFEARDLVT